MDLELVRRAQRDDPGAITELIRCVGPRLFRLAVRLCGDRSEAEEMVSDAIYRGIVMLKRIRDARAAGAWFSRILVNRWRDGLRERAAETLAMVRASSSGYRASSGAIQAFAELFPEEAVHHFSHLAFEAPAHVRPFVFEELARLGTREAVETLLRW